jgi:hypothetical protein
VQVATPEHVRRVDDDHRQARSGQPQRLALRLVLGVDVRDPEAPRPEHLTLVSARAPGRRADGRHRGREHHALDAGLQRLLEHDPRALDVDAEHRVRAGAQRGHPGHVEQPVDALERAADLAAVGDVARDELHVEVGDVVQLRARPAGHADLVAALHERTRHVGPDEPRPARHERGRHGASLPGGDGSRGGA